jgi:hypothetical protein
MKLCRRSDVAFVAWPLAPISTETPIVTDVERGPPVSIKGRITGVS